MIVKIQKSIYPRGLVLVYDKSESVLWQGHMPPAIRKFMGNALKMYAYAHIEGTEVVIDSKATAHDWEARP